MLGSVKKDGDRGTWLFVVDLPPAADGKRRQKKCRGFPIKKAAEAALSEIVGRAQRGPIAEPGRQTLAVSDGLLPRNPAAAVKRPATPKSAAGKVWSADQARRFLTSVAGDRLEALWRLELSTGLRRAEAAGLRWSDVDLDAGALSVRVQRTTEGYAVVEREPKTVAGRRLVPLDADVVAALRAWRKRQIEERLAYGPAYEDSGLVFTREDGAGYHPQRLSVTFRRLCEKAGVEAIRFHDLVLLGTRPSKMNAGLFLRPSDPSAVAPFRAVHDRTPMMCSG